MGKREEEAEREGAKRGKKAKILLLCKFGTDGHIKWAL